jgi:hypothetical protein
VRSSGGDVDVMLLMAGRRGRHLPGLPGQGRSNSAGSRLDVIVREDIRLTSTSVTFAAIGGTELGFCAGPVACDQGRPDQTRRPNYGAKHKARVRPHAAARHGGGGQFPQRRLPARPRVVRNRPPTFAMTAFMMAWKRVAR